MVNKVILIGNLGTDPELRRLESGVAVARINMATNENYRDKNNEWQTLTEWHTVILWRQMAERAEQSLKKGSMVYVEGKLTTRKWQDKDGNDRYSTEVVANYFRAINRRDNTGNNFPGMEHAPPDANANANTSSQNKEDTTSATPATPEAATAPTDDNAEDDLPF